jgi:hypothetical protein
VSIDAMRAALADHKRGINTPFLLKVEQPYKKFLGATQVMTPDQWPFAGRWSLDVDDLKWSDSFNERLPGFFYRSIDVHSPGGKRRLDEDKPPDVCSIGGEQAWRCNSLIDTLPIDNDDLELSRPHIPEWLMKEKAENDLEAESDDDRIIEATKAEARVYDWYETGEGDSGSELAQFLD